MEGFLVKLEKKEKKKVQLKPNSCEETVCAKDKKKRKEKRKKARHVLKPKTKRFAPRY
jgi:hypothetical protein